MIWGKVKRFRSVFILSGFFILFSFPQNVFAASTEVSVESITWNGSWYVINLDFPSGWSSTTPLSASTTGALPLKGLYAGPIDDLMPNNTGSNLKCDGSLPAKPTWDNGTQKFTVNIDPWFHTGQYTGPWASNSGVEPCPQAGTYYAQFGIDGDPQTYYFRYYWTGTEITEYSNDFGLTVLYHSGGTPQVDGSNANPPIILEGFVAQETGIMTSVSGYYADATTGTPTGDSGSWYLISGVYSGAGVNALDCQTESRNFEDWNFPETDVVPLDTIINVGPFTGTECLLTEGNTYSIHSANLSSKARAARANVSGTITYGIVYGGEENTTTRIIDFKPENATTTDNPVFFELEAYINSEDLGTIKGVSLSLHNIDQNVLLLSAFSPNDIWFLDEYNVEQAGYFNYSTTTVLGYGNYRIEACIERTYLGINPSGFFSFINLFSNVNECQSHQFIVGEPTFIGNISQNLWSDTQDFFGDSTATSSAALAASCNPLSGNFGVRECTAFLFIPDPLQLKNTMEEARAAFLTRLPWGYFTRTIEIMSNPATTSLPVITTTLRYGAGSDLTPEETDLTFDIGDMVAGAGDLVDSIEDPIHGQTFRSVFEPMIKGGVALLVLFTIIVDIAGSHKNEEREIARSESKLS